MVHLKTLAGQLIGGNSLTGETATADPDILEQVDQGDVRGVYAKYPASTPKYFPGSHYLAARDHMARLFVPFTSESARRAFIASVPDKAKPLAEALAVSNQNLQGSNGYGMGYIDFLLQSVNESYAETVQVYKPVGDTYTAYFLGQNPPTFQYGGTLLNTYQDDWRAAFTVMYQHILRGTQLARKKIPAVLAYDEVMVTGSLLNMNQSITGDMESSAPFNFSFLVKRYDIHSKSPNLTFKPTPVSSYPYKITPSALSSTPIPGVKKSTYNGDTIKRTTNTQRKKETENSDIAGLTLGAVDYEPDDPDARYIASTMYNYTQETPFSVVGQTVMVAVNQAIKDSKSSELDSRTRELAGFDGDIGPF